MRSWKLKYWNGFVNMEKVVVAPDYDTACAVYGGSLPSNWTWHLEAI